VTQLTVDLAAAPYQQGKSALWQNLWVVRPAAESLPRIVIGSDSTSTIHNDILNWAKAQTALAATDIRLPNG
jgi:hypothetical protein